jgi:hypothetical protein
VLRIVIGFSRGKEAEGGHGDGEVCVKLHGYGRLVELIFGSCRGVIGKLCIIEEAEERCGIWKLLDVESVPREDGSMVDYISLSQQFRFLIPRILALNVGSTSST